MIKSKIKFISVCHGKTEEFFSSTILLDFISYAIYEYKKENDDFTNHILYYDSNKNINESKPIQINNFDAEICKRFSSKFLELVFGKNISFKNKSKNSDFQNTKFVFLIFMDINEENQDIKKQDKLLFNPLDFLKNIEKLDKEIRDKIIDAKVIYCKEGFEKSFNLKKDKNKKKWIKPTSFNQNLSSSINNASFELLKNSYINFFKPYSENNNWFELFDFIDDCFKKY